MERITFKRKPIDIPAEYRPMYLIGLIVMILYHCCRKHTSVLLKLHLFNWCLRSKRNMEVIQKFVDSKKKTKTPYWCIDPALNRALKYAVADNICTIEAKTDKNNRYTLSEKGIALATAINNDTELMIKEKEFLSYIGLKLSDETVLNLTTRKIGL